jgi:p-aminobenzoyl-glutamate transporter AbgT
MPNTVLASPSRLSPVFIALAAFLAVLLASAATLWAYVGPTVFYEMIVAGLAYCF